MALAVADVILSRPIYDATSTVQIQKDTGAGLGLEAMVGGASSEIPDALGANINLQTQADILDSNELALKVINDLKLDKDPDFNRVGLRGKLALLFSPAKKGDESSDSPAERERLLKTFHTNLHVSARPGTRLIDVRYSSPNPQQAALVANTLVQALKDFTFRTRYTSTTETSTWLTSQLADLRKQAEDSQSKLVTLERQRGIVSLGETANGSSGAYSATLDRLRQTTTAFLEAEQNRILKSAIYETVKNGNADTLSGLSGTSLGGASASVNNSLQLLQGLRSQEAEVQSRISLDETKFGPNYPRLVEARSQLKALQNSATQELGRIRERAKSDYEIALRTEAETKAIYDSYNKDAASLNDMNIEYAILRQEADQSRALYEDLLRRLKEAGILEGLKASDVSIVDPALTPFTPAEPKVFLILLGGCVVGLVLALCAGFLYETVDNRIHNTDEIEKQMGLTLFGLLPAFDKTAFAPGRIETLINPQSQFSEALRMTSNSVTLSRGGSAPQVILVTSSVPSEGKSTISLNLSVLLAKTASRVLLVETDLRRPVVRAFLGYTSKLGLTQVLAGVTLEPEMQKVEGVPGLDVLPAGAIPPSPAELLTSARFAELVAKWRTKYEFIVLDCPPTLPVVDPRVIVHLADSVLVVARSGVTTRPALLRTVRLLSAEVGRSKLGVVLNAVSKNSEAFSNYYGYSQRYGGYYGLEKKPSNE